MMTNLALVVGWTLCAFVVFLEIAIIYLIFRGSIDLSRLISEPNGDASMSRFQLLIFTFVVTLCLFLIVAGHPGSFPDIPGSVLALLGISASSYTVSKAIQFSSADGVQERPAEVLINPSSRNLAPGESTKFTATIVRSEETELKWSVIPPVGDIDQSGNYRAPAILEQDHMYVQVRASLVNNPDIYGAATVVIAKGANA